MNRNVNLLPTSILFGRDLLVEADFGQSDFGHRYPTDFGQTDFGQTDFGQS